MLRILLLSVFAAMLPGGPSAWAGDRLVLAIGNADYTQNESDLPTVANTDIEALDVADALERAGFKLANTNRGTIRNRTGEQLRDEITLLVDAVGEDDEVFFYYSGHGFATDAGTFLLGVDAKLGIEDSQDGLEAKGISVQQVLSDLLKKKPARIVMVINACRTVPVLGSPTQLALTSATPSEFAVDLGDGTTDVFLVYSAAPGEFAFDSLPGDSSFDRHTVFGRAFLEVFRDDTPFLEIVNQTQTRVDELMKDVDLRLASTDGGPPVPARQTVWYVDAARREICYSATKACNRRCSALYEAAVEFDRALDIDAARSAYTTFARKCRPASDIGLETVAGKDPRIIEVEARISELATDSREPITRANFAPGLRFQTPGCEDCPEMVVLEGAEAYPVRTGDQSQPIKTVAIPPFAMARTEVTRGQFEEFVRDTSYTTQTRCNVVRNTSTGWAWLDSEPWTWDAPSFEQDHPNHPVVCVSGRDIQAYVDWLNQLDQGGGVYRLPSEVEWTYAADLRGQIPANEDSRGICLQENLRDRAAAEEYPFKDALTCDDKASRTDRVGRKAANVLGLHDMIGNVSERVADCWNPIAMLTNTPSDAAPLRLTEQGDCPSNVLKGGSWISNPKRSTHYERRQIGVQSAYFDSGFRLVYTIGRE